MPLTDTKIRTFKISDKPVKLADGGGLYLHCSNTGRKYWRLAYSFDNKAKSLSLGEYPGITLQRAREKRMEAKRLLDEGIDPGALKKAAKEAEWAEITETFRNVAQEWHATRTEDFTEKHRGTVMFRLEKYVFPILGDKHINRIEPRDVLALVRPIDQQGHNETARRLIQIIAQVYRYALIVGRRVQPGKRPERRVTAPESHPQSCRHRTEESWPASAQHRQLRWLLSYYMLAAAGPTGLVRPTELRAAVWSEFNLEEHEWRIPAARTKMKQMHIVPLSKQAMQILEELHPYSGTSKYLFPSIRSDVKPISNVTMLDALRRMGYAQDEMCTHGFRSIASTLLNELGYNRDWIERQLAHGERNDVRAAYYYAEYLPQRRKMMQEWADYLDTLKNAS